MTQEKRTYRLNAFVTVIYAKTFEVTASSFSEAEQIIVDRIENNSPNSGKIDSIDIQEIETGEED